MTKDNDGWGTPVPIANYLLQSQNAAKQIAQTTANLAADGWTQTASDEWTKVVEPRPTATEAFNPAKDSPATQAQMAQLFASKGTPEQQHQALDWLTGAEPVAHKDDADAWPVEPVTTLDDTRELPEDAAFRSARESQWGDDPNAELDLTDFAPVGDETYGASDDERARAANACMSIDPQTPWVVDVPDGELSLKEDYMPTVTPGVECGFYVAYSQGILHCILAGPYETVANARGRFKTSWERFEADPAMGHAFAKDGWNREGLYVAEIPMKARRRGAYGLI